jgi:uncharacterized DUF497 family protein
LPSAAGFEWDPAKREANLRMHGVDFVRAVAMFERWTLEWSDVGRRDGEYRVVAVGGAGERILTVVYTWRSGQRRIISARRSSGKEARAYRAVQAGDEGPHRLGAG